MKHYRRMLSLFLCALCLSPAVCAAEENAPAPEPETEVISPGIRVLAARQVLKKNAQAAFSETEDSGGGEILFSVADFADVLGYTPSQIVIKSLPDRSIGSLKLGTLEVAAGCALSPSAVEHLRFVPLQTGEGEDIRCASFTFTAAGKVYRTDTPLACTLYLLNEKNAAPTAADANGVTYTETPLYGRLQGQDADADTLSYEIVRMPKKGSVTFDGATGEFIYTPAVGKRGRDVFTYRVSDPWGNRSELRRVEVEIRRAGEQFCYADLEEEDCAAAAMYLGDEGIMRGTTLGGAPVFSPELPVTRGEFLVFAMQAAALAPDVETGETVFADLASYPAYMQPYLMTAYENGILSGTVDESGARICSADTPITGAEAAVIVSKLFPLPLRPSDGTYAVYAEQITGMEDAAVPAWSVGAYAALRTAGIIGDVGNASAPMTRAETAKLLAGAMWQTESSGARK